MDGKLKYQIIDTYRMY